MTPSARCQAAIDILDAIEQSTRAADSIIRYYFRARRYAGSGDRRATQALVYVILRKRGQLDWWGQRVGIEITSRLRVLIALILCSPWEGITPKDAFLPGKYGPGPLSESEAAAIAALCGESLDHSTQPKSISLNMPMWLEPLFCPEIRDNYKTEIKNIKSEGDVDLRVNTLKSSRDEVLSELRDAGIEGMPTPFAPHGIRLERRLPLKGLSAFRHGLFELQGEASQLAVELAGVKPGQSVLDLCAGAGGKALAIAACMRNEGRLVLHDIDPARLRRAEERMQRAGVNIHENQVNTASFSLEKIPNEEKFDSVIIDAPCSGSGVWRRNPEAKWRLNAERLSEHSAQQHDLLQIGAKAVRPGGRLVYMTCSILAEENRDRIDEFLTTAGANFELVTLAVDWRRVTGQEFNMDGADLQLTPARHGTDGFYVALLRRRLR
jgi:16S rRNA (cytosine967-C5)-methyltransferase